MKNLNYLKVKLLVTFCVLVSGVHAQDTCEIENKFVAFEMQDVEYLGGRNAVDISGNYAIVGGVGNNDLGTASGAAYIYHKQGSTWVPNTKLFATDGSPLDRFGQSVAIWGDYAVVGSPFDDINGLYSGSVYIFHRIGQFWIQEFKISPSDGSSSDRFGWDVDIWEDYIVVSSLNDHTPAAPLTGSAYFFKREGDEWIEINKVYPEDGTAFDEFGGAISIKDNMALIGSSKNDENGTESGAAYMYANQDTAWVFTEKLIPGDASAGAQFGFSVSVSESLATIGAYQDIFNVEDTTGAVYVFRQDEMGWQEEQKITTPETTNDMNFGRSNDHFNDRLIIGTTRANTPSVDNSGATFLYEYNGSTWEYLRKITADDAQHADFYASSVAMEGNHIIVGALGEDSNGGDGGAAYVHYVECNPVCTSISSPINGGVSVPLDADINWYTVDNATGYLVSIGTTPGGADILDSFDVTDTTLNLANDLSEDTDYFVNITPYNDAGNSTDCVESTFTTSEILMTLNVGADVTIPCYEPVPVPTYVVNNICAEATVSIVADTIPGNCSAEYTIVRTYTATDGCSTLSDTETIIVDDMDGPEITSEPEDVVLACGEDLPTDIPTAIDQCNAEDVTITFVDTPAPMCGMVIERLFSVTDACGNVTTVTQLITIESSDGLPSCSFLDSPSGEDNQLDVSLVWTEATDAIGYVLNVGTTTGGTDIVDGLDVLNVLTYDLTSLMPGTTYYVNVIPYNAIGDAAFCGEFEFTTSDVPSCSMLELPDENPVYPVDVDLQWSSSSDADGYLLSVGTTSGGIDIVDNEDVMNVLTYNFEVLPELTTIYLTITPYNELGNAEECAEFSFVTDVVIGIDEKLFNKNISIYPNPTNGESFTIAFENENMAQQTEEIMVFDALGKRVIHFSNLQIINSTFKVNVKEELNSGVYNVTIKTSEGLYRKSLVIE